ncbi:MAG: MBL fold metallo-hydrolase [Magnetococcales bacterium]|nr:MBL fold metallo-hydrolase [Magnetococcales bacterium]
MDKTLFQSLPFDITLVDTGYHRDRCAAGYLVQSRQGSAAIVETGPLPAAKRFLTLLEERKLPREAVEWVIVTHVHLDHAGGAGGLLRELPNAKLLVHPKGLRHLVEPEKLRLGVMAVYGEETFRVAFEDIVPAPAERCVEGSDGLEIRVGERLFTVVDSPGHARHHFCLFEAASGSLFTGDAFGIAYPELTCPDSERPFLFPATTPVQFEPEIYQETVDRLAALKPRNLFLTHFGMVGFEESMAQALHHWIERIRHMAVQAPLPAPERLAWLHTGLEEIYRDELAQHLPGFSWSRAKGLLAMDLEINAQGIDTWLGNIRR